MKKVFSKVAWLVFVLLASVSLVLISDSGNTATTAPKTAAVKKSAPKVTPQYGGTLVVRHPLPISVGYPAKLTSQGDLDVSAICVDNLLRFTETGKPLPWLATAWKYSADFKSLTLTLRQGVKFHDGTDFNAAAVKTNLDLCKAAKKGELASVSSVDVIDNYTVKLNLSRLDAYLLTNFGESAGMMISPAALAKGEDWCRTNPVGTGPFKQVEFKSGVSAKYEKWEGYWQKGKPYLDAVQIVDITNDMTALAAFKKGEIHTLSTRDPLIVKELKDANISTIPTYLVLAPDSAHKDSPLADIKVRQAIAYAIDSNTIQNSFGAGLFKLSNQLVDKSTVYYNSNINAYPYNLQKAKEVLATSRFPSGFTLDIIYPNTFSCDTQLTAVQSMLSKINIQVNLKSLAGGAVVQARTDGWQNGFLVLALGIAPEKDPGRQLQILFSKDQAASGLFAVTARSEKYDSLLSSIIQEPDFDKRNALDKQLLKQMIDGDCMILSVYNNGWIYPKVANLKDAKIGEVWFHQWTPEDAWFSK